MVKRIVKGLTRVDPGKASIVRKIPGRFVSLSMDADGDITVVLDIDKSQCRDIKIVINQPSGPAILRRVGHNEVMSRLSDPAASRLTPGVQRLAESYSGLMSSLFDARGTIAPVTDAVAVVPRSAYEELRRSLAEPDALSSADPAELINDAEVRAFAHAYLFGTPDRRPHPSAPSQEPLPSTHPAAHICRRCRYWEPVRSGASTGNCSVMHQFTHGNSGNSCRRFRAAVSAREHNNAP